ncbi:MAG TPA: putative metalloprotease CJM1_0395 family protein [Dissulfurispiraceae bacterium]|nr:putative metalloprotease CJM1_0395 family protein [Dissulfurispiraceae bacterium]
MGSPRGSVPASTTTAFGNVSDQMQQEIERLQRIDREVRAHEQAHRAAGGQYAGAAHFEFQRGPDGNLYAVSGEVPIDASREKDPDATIAKMGAVRAAALAPAHPSGQDVQVAAEAAKIESEARQERARKAYETAAAEGRQTEQKRFSSYV